MSSTGQIVGAFAGAVIGFFVAGPAGAFKGAAYGAALGGYVDPPPGPNLKGPTLDDTTFQSSAYGADLPDLSGTIATMGNIIWLENNSYKSVVKKESAGGKGGGGGGTYETTTYYATFAIALANEIPGSTVRRVWAGGKLIYSVGTDDFDTLLQSAAFTNWRYYDGTQTVPDSRMEASFGIGNCPSYEGTAYMVLYDFDLTNYGNGLAGCPIKVELVCSDGSESFEPRVVEFFKTPELDYSEGATSVFSGGGFYIPGVTWPTIRGADSHSGSVAGRGAVELGTVSEPTSSPGSTVSGGHPNRSIMGVVNSSEGWRKVYRTVDATFYLYAETISGSRSILVGFTVFGTPEDYANVLCVLDEQYGFALLIYRGFSPRIYGVLSDTGDFYPFERDSAPAAGFNELGQLIVIDPDDGLGGTKTRTVVILENGGFGWESVGSFSAVLPVMNSDSSVFGRGNYIYIFGRPTAGGLPFRVINYSGQTVYSTNVDLSDALPGGYLSTAMPPLWGYKGDLFGFACAVGGADVFRPTEFVFLKVAAPGGFFQKRLDVLVSEIVSAVPGVGALDVSELSADYVDGYKVPGSSSPRAALAPLQAAYLFDVIEQGYGIVAKKRGVFSSEIIPISKIIYRGGDSADGLINRDIEKDTQLPSRYSVSYIDRNREYDTNAQMAEYPCAHENARSESLAIVMTEDAAAVSADIFCNLSWAERESLTFELPQTFLHLKASDEKILEYKPGRFRRVRLNSIEKTSSQTVKVFAKSSDQFVYVSNAVGSASIPPSELISFIGDTRSVLMDIPMILDEYNQPGFPAAVYASGSWPGAVLFMSVDAGQTYTAKQAFGGLGTVGRSLNSLGISDCFVIERGSNLLVSEFSGSFSAVSESVMMTGKNFAAYGAQGRWEIIRFANATLQADGSVLLSTFVRGCRGTEWATGLHTAGDLVVLLDDIDNIFITESVATIGLDRLFKAVTVGKNVVDVNASAFVYAGVNLKPLSPVNVSAVYTPGVDCVISWFARTRFSSSFWLTGMQPQNEPVMAFDIEIMNGSDVVRTLQSSVSSVAYTEAMMIEDFGAAQTVLSVKIYQISATVGRGYPRAATI